MNTIKSKLISSVFAATCLGLTYFISMQPEPGLGAYLLGLPAAAIVAITALVRGNDLPTEVKTWRGHVRRAGFYFTGGYAVSFIIRPISGDWPGWFSLLALWGGAGTWLTTPNMPPWWDYITGKKGLRRKEIL